MKTSLGSRHHVIIVGAGFGITALGIAGRA